MKNIILILIILIPFSLVAQQNQPSGTLKLIQSPGQYYRPADSTIYNYKSSIYKWNRLLTSKDSAYLISKTNLKQDKFSGITTNYVPKWNGTTLVNGILFDNGSVGIGNAAPGSKLDVTGQTTTTTLKVTDQAGANKMLISDSNGLLSYTNAYPGAGIPISTGTYWNTSITNNSVGWNRAVIDTLRWSGTATGLVASTARTSLGGTTVGQNLFTLANPSAITFPRINADNSVSTLTASAFLTAIGSSPAAGSSSITTVGTLSAGSIPYSLLSGTVPTWNQNTTGSAATLTTARTIAGTSFNGSANIALTNKFIAQGTTDNGITGAQFLGGLATGIVKNTTTTGVLSIATGADLPVMSATVGGAVPTPPNNTTTFLRGDGTFTSLGGTTVGQNLFTLANPSAITFPRINADNSVSTLTASAFLTAIGSSPAAGSSSITTVGTLSAGSIPYSLLSGTVPTWNQNTTGSAATLTTARTIAGTSFNGSANIALTNKFIAQGTTDNGITGAQFLGGLSTGIVKNTITTGVLSIATGADLPTMTATVGGAVPTPPNNTLTFLRGDGTFAAPPGSTIDNHQHSLTSVAGIGGGNSVYTNSLTYTPKGSHALFIFSAQMSGTAGDNWQFSFSNETTGGFGRTITGRTQTFSQYPAYQQVLYVAPNVSIIFHVQMWAATTTTCAGELTIIDLP